jgi:hypothetical protein
MADTDPPPDEFDPQFYHVIGNITSDWALLEYRINQCIWRLAQIEHDPLGACHCTNKHIPITYRGHASTRYGTRDFKKAYPENQ